MADSNYAFVAFLAKFEAAGSVPATDKKGRALTAAGNATVTSDGGAITGAYLTLDGTGDYVTTPGTTDLQLGAGDFCVDLSIKTTANNKCLLDYYDGTTTGWQVFLTSSGYLEWWNSSAVKTGAIAVNDGNRHHVAIVRRSGSIYLYIDGVLDGAGVANTTNHNTTKSVVAIGAQVISRNASYDLAGSFDFVRITIGVSRWAAAFTPPTLADLAQTADVSASDGVQYGTSTSGTGAYRAQCIEFSVLDSAFAASYHWRMVEQIGIGGVLGATKRGDGAISSTIGLASALLSRSILNGRASDAMMVADTASSNLVFKVSAIDGVRLYEAELVSGNVDDALDVWLANVATSAHSRYAQYGFNSFATFEGKQYGCKSDGVYELGGALDGANPVKWTVTFAEQDFGASNMKRFESVYVGAKATGQLVLKVINGDGTAYHYNVIPSGNEGRTSRALVGRGLSGRYWLLELASDTERAELDSIDFAFAVMSRRI